MHLALIFGDKGSKAEDKSHKIRNMYKSKHDDIVCDCYSNIQDYIKSSDARNIVYDRVILLSTVIRLSIERDYIDLDSYIKRNPSTVYVVIARVDIDDSCVQTFTSIVRSASIAVIPVHKTTGQTFEDALNFSITEINSRYNCITQTNIEVEYETYAMPDSQSTTEPKAETAQKTEGAGSSKNKKSKKKKRLLARIKEAYKLAKQQRKLEEEQKAREQQQVDKSISEGMIAEPVAEFETEETETIAEFKTVEAEVEVAEMETEEISSKVDISENEDSFDENAVEEPEEASASIADEVEISEEVEGEETNDSEGTSMAVENSEVADTGEFSEELTENHDINVDVSSCDDDENNSEISTENSNETEEIAEEEDSSASDLLPEEPISFEDIEVEDASDFFNRIADGEDYEADIETVDFDIEDVSDEEAQGTDTVEHINVSFDGAFEEVTVEDVVSEASEEELEVNASEATVETIEPEVNPAVVSNEESDVVTETTAVPEETVSTEEHEEHIVEEINTTEETIPTPDPTVSNETPNTRGTASYISEEVTDVIEDTFSISDNGTVEDISDDELLISDCEEVASTNSSETPTSEPTKQKKKGISGFFKRRNKPVVAPAESAPEVNKQNTGDVSDSENNGYSPDDVIEDIFDFDGIVDMDKEYQQEEIVRNTRIVEKVIEKPVESSKSAIEQIKQGRAKKIIVVTGSRGSGVTSVAYDIALFFTKYCSVLYVDGDTELHGLLNYVDYQRVVDYEDIKLKGIGLCKSLDAFQNCVIRFDKNLDLLLSDYFVKTTDDEYITMQSVLTDIAVSGDYGVIVCDIPMCKLHLCEDLLIAGTTALVVEASQRGYMNLCCDFANSELRNKYKKTLVSRGSLVHTKITDKFNDKNLKRYVSQIVDFEEGEANWLEMKSLTKNGSIDVKFIEELLE